MRRRYLNGEYVLGFFIGLIMIFLLVGCSVGPGTGNINIKDYHVGTQGINILFFKSNLKDVFETDTMGRSLYIQNKGAYSVNETQKASLSVSYDEYYINLNKDSPINKRLEINNLEGKNINNPLGGEDYYEYVFNVSALNSLRETVKTTINYQLCYPYKTETTIATCIDTRKYTQDQSAPVCKQTTYSSSSGQGGPMAITKIVPEISMSGSITRPQFSIYVANKGSGYVINNTGTDVCSDQNVAKRAGNLGTVKVNAMLSGRELTCSPSEIRLKSGDNIARCFVSDNDLQYYNRTTRNYVAPLTVTLDYGYVIIEKEVVTIKRLNDIRPDVEATSCGYYEYYDDGKCVSLCEYCRRQSPPYPQVCAERLSAGNATKGFLFDNDFSCSCTKTTCLALRKDGQCVFGFCAGSNYCCNNDECRGKEDNSTCGDHYVCKDNKCKINNPEYTMCVINYGANYTCKTDTDCNSTIIHNLCPGDEHNICCHKL